jgi:hypothetical protein
MKEELFSVDHHYFSVLSVLMRDFCCMRKPISRQILQIIKFYNYLVDEFKVTNAISFKDALLAAEIIKSFAAVLEPQNEMGFEIITIPTMEIISGRYSGKPEHGPNIMTNLNLNFMSRKTLNYKDTHYDFIGVRPSLPSRGSPTLVRSGYL